MADQPSANAPSPMASTKGERCPSCDGYGWEKDPTNRYGPEIACTGCGGSGRHGAQTFKAGDRVRHVSGWEDVIDHVWPNGQLAFTPERDYFKGSAWSPTVFTNVEAAAASTKGEE